MKYFHTNKSCVAVDICRDHRTATQLMSMWSLLVMGEPVVKALVIGELLWLKP